VTSVGHVVQPPGPDSVSFPREKSRESHQQDAEALHMGHRMGTTPRRPKGPPRPHRGQQQVKHLPGAQPLSGGSNEGTKRLREQQKTPSPRRKPHQLLEQSTKQELGWPHRPQRARISPAAQPLPGLGRASLWAEGKRERRDGLAGDSGEPGSALGSASPLRDLG